MPASYDNLRVDATISIAGQTFNDITVKEVILGESLLTPGLQTAITLQSWAYSNPQKIWGDYKNKDVTINMTDQTGFETRTMYTRQKIYRIDNRELDVNIGQTETLTLHACDESLLNDAQSLISKSWKCTAPSEIVKYALMSCANVPERNLKVTSAGPARDYIAENIHPFQVVQQQCNVALYRGDDPSFLHYMTYGLVDDSGNIQNWEPIHYFKSLGELIQGTSPLFNFSNAEGDGDLYNMNLAISFSFPCVFDYLSDLMNGAVGGNSLSTINTMTQDANVFGGSVGGCGIGKGNHKTAITNSGTSQQQNSCDLGVEQYLLLRQARMGLLEKDKIALRITVPWNSKLHVGQKISFNWVNKSDRTYNVATPIYGSGNYLIVSLKHNIQLGGFATTTLDCITDTVNA